MKPLFNNGAYIISIFSDGEVRIGKINGALFGLRPVHRLYTACVTERQPGTVKMLYDTLCEEYFHEPTSN